jgi:hypothetical protein
MLRFHEDSPKDVIGYPGLTIRVRLAAPAGIAITVIVTGLSRTPHIGFLTKSYIAFCSGSTIVESEQGIE